MSDPSDNPEFIELPQRAIAKVPFEPVAMDFVAPPTNPIAEMARWFAEAFQLPTSNPNAMALSTVDHDGTPSVRTVLLKAFDENGLVFFTNRQSAKGNALAHCHKAEALFHWDLLDRQIRVKGTCMPTCDDLSDAYFQSRPIESRIGAWASDQSRPLESRELLDQRILETVLRFAGREVERPPHWGGYRIALDRIEFWQGHPHRIHDRIVYRRHGSGWDICRLFP